jgi:LPS export ABC transporter protein LptC
MKYKAPLISLFVICSAFFLASCENDLKDVERISNRSISIPVDKSYGVEIIYSDSAKVKARVLTPELHHYDTEKPYYEMPKGVTLILLDENKKETSRITSDYAIMRENDKITELKRNVVAVNKEGKIFKSEELIYDQNQNKFYSNQLVSIITKTQTINGTSFWANESFSYYEIQQSTGNFDVPGNGSTLGNDSIVNP